MSYVAYLRVSSDDQTTENQRQQIEKQYQISKWFCDVAISGSVAAANRPGMAACLEYMREGDTLVVIGLDRLGRSTIDVLSTIAAIQAKGALLITLREGLDLSTPAGQMMAAVFASFAQMERALMLERQAAGIARARNEGKHLGRPVDTDKHRQIIELRTAGVSIAKTAEQAACSIATVKNVMAAHRKQTASAAQ